MAQKTLVEDLFEEKREAGVIVGGENLGAAEAVIGASSANP